MWNANICRLGILFSRNHPAFCQRSLSSASATFAAVWGNGDHGRLGLGNSASQWSPHPLPPSAFHGHALSSIACGGAHTLFLTDSGRVFATGLNDFGQLGTSPDVSYTLEPLQVSGLDKEIVHISAGYCHSCAITVDGDLYMWGNNRNGQLGLGKKAPTVAPVPAKVECLSGVTIKLAALGLEHSIAITDGGETLTWGGGSGRLGHDHESSTFSLLRSTREYTPRLVKKLDGVKVKKVAAGLMHSACIDENGSLYIFDEEAENMLGFRWLKDDTGPLMENTLQFSEEVACGGYHTCVVTRSGELYTWGLNENGCLGDGTTDALNSPEQVLDPFENMAVSKVSCGWKHTAAISDGKIFTWGWGGSHGTFSEDGQSSAGQLGHGSDVDYVKPGMVNFGESVKALQISCGINHTGAILERM